MGRRQIALSVLVAVRIRAEVLNDDKPWNKLSLQIECCSDGSTSIWSERIRAFKVRKCITQTSHAEFSRVMPISWLSRKLARLLGGGASLQGSPLGVGGPSVGYITFDLLHNVS